MRFTLHLLLLLPFSLASQENIRDYEWEHFHLFKPVRDALETNDAIWWAMDDYLVRYDRADASATVGINPFPNRRFLSYENLWADQQGQVHAYDRDEIAILGEQGWTYHSMPLTFGFQGIEKLLHRSEENEYLLLSKNASVYSWSSGNLPTPVFGLEAAVADASWDAIEQRLWFTSGLELGYLKDDIFTAVSLPANTDLIEQMQTSADGALWLQFANQVLRLKDGNWARYTYPTDLQSTNVQLAVNQSGQALLNSLGRTLLLELEGNTFSAVDWTEAIGLMPYTTALLLDKWGQAWWIRDQDRGIGHFLGQGETQWQRPSNWLPFTNYITSTAVDQDGRVWIANGSSCYFYSDRQWWPAKRLYPNFPDTVRQILFTEDSEPIVLSTVERIPGINSNSLLYWYRQNQWYPIPLTDLGTGSRFFVDRLELDVHGNLWGIDLTGAGFAVWERGQWEYIIPTDFFPAPTRITDIVVDKESRQYIASNNGYYIKDGLSYEYIPYERYGIPNLNGSLSYRNIRLSADESLWITVRGKVIKAEKNGEGAEVPIEDVIGQSFTSDRIYDIIPFADDDVWLLYLNDGLAHYNGQYWNHIHVGNTTPLPWDKMSYLEKDPLGRLWFTHAEGVSVLSPPKRSVVFAKQRTETKEMTIMPNPACCLVQLSWQQTEQERVQIWLADAQGRQIKSIFDQILSPGAQDLMIQRDGLPSGVYYAVRQSGTSIDASAFVWK
ncbi:MAG: hypothetical protein AAFN81_17475 [Bacteroidota bacterium]